MYYIDEKIEELETRLAEWKNAQNQIEDAMDDAKSVIEEAINEAIENAVESVIEDLSFDLQIDTSRLEDEVRTELVENMKYM